MGIWGPVAFYVMAPVMWVLLAIFATGPIVEYFTWPRVPGLIGPTVDLCTVRWYASPDAKYPNRKGPMHCEEARRIREANPQISYRTSVGSFVRLIYKVPGEAKNRDRYIEPGLHPDGTAYKRGDRIELVVSPSGEGFAKPVPRVEDWWYILAGLVALPLAYLYAFTLWLCRRSRYAY